MGYPHILSACQSWLPSDGWTCSWIYPNTSQTCRRSVFQRCQCEPKLCKTHGCLCEQNFNRASAERLAQKRSSENEKQRMEAVEQRVSPRKPKKRNIDDYVPSECISDTENPSPNDSPECDNATILRQIAELLRVYLPAKPTFNSRMTDLTERRKRCALQVCGSLISAILSLVNPADPEGTFSCLLQDCAFLPGTPTPHDDIVTAVHFYKTVTDKHCRRVLLAQLCGHFTRKQSVSVGLCVTPHTFAESRKDFAEIMVGLDIREPATKEYVRHSTIVSTMEWLLLPQNSTYVPWASKQIKGPGGKNVVIPGLLKSLVTKRLFAAYQRAFEHLPPQQRLSQKWFYQSSQHHIQWYYQC